MKKIKEIWPVVAIFVAFLILMIFQFLNVGNYYDDFGYYSLNYGAQTKHIGSSFSFAELFRFLKEHYAGANGRLLYFFVWLGLFKIGGTTLVKVMGAISLTAVMVLILKISLGDSKKSVLVKTITAMTLCLSFCLLPIELHRHGTYWMIAFYLYYVSLIPFLGFILLYFRKKKTSPVLLTVLSFLSAWSWESFGVAVFVLMGLLFLIKTIKEKKFAVSEFIYTLVSALGVLILFLSPGIWARGEATVSDLSLLGRIKSSTALAFAMYFSAYQKLYLRMLFLASAIISVHCARQKKKIEGYVFSVLLVGLTILEYVKPEFIRSWYEKGLKGLMAYFFVFILLLIPNIKRCVERKDLARSFLLLTGLISVMALAMVPSFPERVYIPFTFFTFLIIEDGVILSFEFLKEKKALGIIVFALCLFALLIAPACKNGYKIFRGYQINNSINVENDRILKDASEKLKKGETISEINLFRFPEGQEMYASTMYYQLESTWFKDMIFDFYEIPKDIGLNYK